MRGGASGARAGGSLLAHTSNRLGLKVAIADIDAKALDVLAAELGAAHGETNVLAVATDVSRLEEVVHLRERVYEAWGEVSVVCACAVHPPSLFFAGRRIAQ